MKGTLTKIGIREPMAHNPYKIGIRESINKKRKGKGYHWAAKQPNGEEHGHQGGQRA